jgi:hypothetical protein
LINASSIAAVPLLREKCRMEKLRPSSRRGSLPRRTGMRPGLTVIARSQRVAFGRPDDKLRDEAIQFLAPKSWIASSQGLLAMTAGPDATLVGPTHARNPLPQRRFSGYIATDPDIPRARRANIDP